MLTLFFLIVILGSTDRRAPAGFAPIAIGLALTLIHLISIPGHQHFGQSGAQHRAGAFRRAAGAGQLWLFWLAPLIGGALGGVIYRCLGGAGQK